MGLQLQRLNYGQILLDDELRIVGLNSCIKDKARVQAKDCHGRPVSEVFPALDVARLKRMIERLQEMEGDRVIDATPGDPLWPGLFEVTPDNSDGCQLVLLNRISRISASSCYSLMIFHREVLDQLYDQSLVNQAVANQRMLQSEKLAAIGQLAAGVAHEINNPLGFVFSNLKTLGEYVRDLIRIVDNVETAATIDAVRELKQRMDYDYIRSDVASLLTESEDGIERVKTIIGALKDFSHAGEDEFRVADLHRGLDTTLSLVNNELKYKAKIVKDYGDLPPVECVISQINQVAMNLLVNAAQSIEDFGKITIRTGQDAGWAWFEVEDTGKGIEPILLNRIFEPFFTTKPVGSGTGLGLALSYNIVQKHHGRIEVKSQIGQGAVFRVWLPLTQPKTKSISSSGTQEAADH
ncbi:ATP-binding protein [Ottowia caeni]|uniref:ATP-binding protein n=1 Tax=Ottowia caeni TaxID=2870339 RepID=UPI001E5CDFC0|nr:ATP-binding protein [Ottowia caeni]